ncbi:hypothetical protein Cylst_1085 [Cylindrospermum stagnale PCC 7417]|uniref:Uncharacterized protein n=1 Tax=Cylindrospermum stagnale PCC 7417 TaxID=56107 RepID=K9WUB2_9NOST|nr:hypothetical protein [Cylindrospermum stagnale]AFZ23399.1 hypothetical protein Cylst_1085 [Cylindrospermum stagnale PCC 7417]
MKVTIRDSKILKTIEPNVLETYLKSNGWQKKGHIYDGAGAIWKYKKYAEGEFEILLPLRQSLYDYAARIIDAIKILEEVENRSQIHILSELITTYPNITIQGVVMQIQMPNPNQLRGEITLLGVVVDQLRKIHTELADCDYILAIKAYQERSPVFCIGDLIKKNNRFILENPRQFSLDKLANT